MGVKSKAVIGGLLFLAVFSVGRYSAPERVRIETKVVEVVKEVKEAKTVTSRDKHRKTTVVEVVRPDGTKETTSTTEEATQTNKTRETDTATESETDSIEVKEVTRTSNKTVLSVLYGIPVTGGLPTYGGHVTRSLLGPIYGGGFVLTPGVVGVSLGIAF